MFIFSPHLSLCPSDISFSVMHRKSRADLFQCSPTLASELPRPHRTDISVTNLAHIHSLQIIQWCHFAIYDTLNALHTYSSTNDEEAKNNLKIGHEVITKTEMWRNNLTWGDKSQLPIYTALQQYVLELLRGMRDILQQCKVIRPGIKRHPIPAREGAITWH